MGKVSPIAIDGVLQTASMVQSDGVKTIILWFSQYHQVYNLDPQQLTSGFASH